MQQLQNLHYTWASVFKDKHSEDFINNILWITCHCHGDSVIYEGLLMIYFHFKALLQMTLTHSEHSTTPQNFVEHVNTKYEAWKVLYKHFKRPPDAGAPATPLAASTPLPRRPYNNAYSRPYERGSYNLSQPPPMKALPALQSANNIFAEIDYSNKYETDEEDYAYAKAAPNAEAAGAYYTMAHSTPLVHLTNTYRGNQEGAKLALKHLWWETHLI